MSLIFTIFMPRCYRFFSIFLQIIIRSKEMYFCLPHLPFVDVQRSDPHKRKDLLLYKLQTLIRIISELFCHGRERRSSLEDRTNNSSNNNNSNNQQQQQ